MKLFTLSLMTFISVFGVSMGFKAITGRDLVNVEWLMQSNQPVRGAPAPATKTALPPTPQSTAPPAEVPPASPFEPWWVQNHAETDLWSGPDGGAVSLGKAPQWNYFQVIERQNGPRLHVRDPLTDKDAYIDASAVGPFSAPGSPATPLPSQTQKVVGNTDGMGVYVRRSPRADDKLRAWQDGTPMEVIEENVDGDGRMWTKVKSPDGAVGYVPAEYLVPGT